MTDTRIYLLGAMQIERKGRSLSGIRSQKALALLGYLAVEARPVARTTLAALFWGNEPATKARRELRRVIHNLTSLVPGCLEADRNIVRFCAAPASMGLSVDIQEFAALIAVGDIESMMSAINLYQGELLEGLYLDDCPQFETWLLGERELWRQQAFQLFQQLIAYHRNQADFVTAVTLTQRCLAIDPWREETHRQLMLLQARSGQFSAAVKQFENCRAILLAELGVGPSLETVTLYERIKAATAVTAHNLPPQRTAFIGREDEIATIHQFLRDPNRRLLTITGLGGMGKSRLATAAARQSVDKQARWFLHGIRFVPLLEIETTVHLAATIASAIGLVLQGKDSPEKQLLNYLQDREMLLLLDNYEHLLPDVGLITRLLQHAPNIKLLVTSRAMLNLQAETILQLHGLPFPTGPVEELGVDSLQAYFAVALFTEHATQIQPQFDLKTDALYVTRLCRLVDGMPLALELASGWLQTLSCAGIVQEVERNLDILVTTQPDLPPRHRSWRAVFNASWQRLGLEERNLLARLSIFQGSFTRSAAEKITGGSLPQLHRLVTRSLLKFDPIYNRYSIHELLRQFSAEKLDPQMVNLLRDNHLNFYTAWSEAVEPKLYGSEQAKVLHQFDSELGNLRNALAWAAEDERRSDTGMRLAAAYFDAASQRSYASEAYKWLQRFLVRVENAQSIAPWARGLCVCGHAEIYFGNPTTAKSFLKHSLSLYQQLEDERGIAEVSLALGFANRHLGNWSQAKQYYQDALLLFESLNVPFRVSLTIQQLGRLAAMQHEWQEAKQHYHLALDLEKQRRNHTGAAFCLWGLGYIHTQEGELDLAENYLKQAEVLAQEMENSRLVATAVVFQANLARLTGNYQYAVQRYDDVIPTWRTLGLRHLLALDLMNKGMALLRQSDFVMAAVQFRESLTFTDIDEASKVFALNLAGLAGIALHREDVEESVCLLGFTSVWFEQNKIVLDGVDLCDYDWLIAKTEDAMEGAEFVAIWQGGQDLSVEEAVTLAGNIAR